MFKPTSSDFSTNREKLEAIQEVVGSMFGQPLGAATIEGLMLIDSICDVPLFGALNEDKEWTK